MCFVQTALSKICEEFDARYRKNLLLKGNNTKIVLLMAKNHNRNAGMQI